MWSRTGKDHVKEVVSEEKTFVGSRVERCVSLWSYSCHPGDRFFPDALETLEVVFHYFCC